MYFLERFGSLEISAVMGVQRAAGGGDTPAASRLFAGGGYDLHGNERVPRGARLVTARAEIDGTAAERQTALDAWYAAGNTRERLFRRSATDVVQWQWARLIPPDPELSYNRPLWFEIDLNWLVYGDTWNGLRHGNGLDLDATPAEGFDEGLVLDYEGSQWDTEYTMTGSPYSVTLNNGGNMTQHVATFTFTPNTAPFTAITFPSLSHAWTYTGSVAVNQYLLVHTGAHTVRLQTTLLANAGSGDTALNVASSASYAVGKHVAVLMDDGGYHYTTIAAVPDLQHVTLATALPGAASAPTTIGMGVYENFTEPSGSMEWIHLAPGDNTFNVVYTGGGTAPVFKADFYDAWA